MRISDTVRSTWLALFGKRMPRSLIEGDKCIQVWNDIYAGRPEWQKYTTRGIGGKRTEWRYLLNAGKIVCSELSGLVFAEKPIVTASDDVLKILEDNRFADNARGWLETALALGTGALKWVQKDGKLIIDWVKACDFVPVSYDARGITEADFVSSVVHENKEYKIVERHRKEGEGYRITLAAYENVGFDLYREVPAERAGFAVTEWTVPRKIFEAFTNPETNNLDLYSPLGISIFANAVDTIQQLDRTFDYLAEELETSRRKIILPASMISTYFDQTGKTTDLYYDKNERVYVAFNADEVKDMTPIAIDFDLRIEKITATLNALLSVLSRQCGLSDSFLSFDGVSTKTATEVISENSKTFRTKKNLENALGYTLVSFLESLDAFGISSDVSIAWDDSVIEDRNSRAEYWNARVAQGTALLEDALVAMDGLTEDEAKEKAAAIRSSRATVDIGSMFGGQE